MKGNNFVVEYKKLEMLRVEIRTIVKFVSSHVKVLLFFSYMFSVPPLFQNIIKDK